MTCVHPDGFAQNAHTYPTAQIDERNITSNSEPALSQRSWSLTTHTALLTFTNTDGFGLLLCTLRE